MRRALTFLLFAGISSAAAPAPRRPAPPVLSGIDALRADFLGRTGTDTVYFGTDNVQLGAPARAVLAAQAMWLRRHPEVVIRIEGYGDPGDTRDHALAVGARRAQEVRKLLIVLGIPDAQLGAMSWGKERLGTGRAVIVLVR
jgi:peptidoglycan-associated lipoprotein